LVREGLFRSNAGAFPVAAWKPGDPDSPNQFHVNQWVHTRIGELLAINPDCELDELEGEIFGDLGRVDCNEEIWEWTVEAIKRSLGQTMRLEPEGS
jgi:hypothetical protein